MMRPPLFIALWVTLTACSVSSPDAPELTEIDLLTLNGLSPTLLADNLEAIKALATGPLDQARTDLVDSEGGREVLSYVVRCALSEHLTAEFPVLDESAHPVGGQLGFVPEWFDRALDDTGKRVLSACILAHVNAFSVHVPFSARSVVLGEPTLADLETHPVQEGSFYGNLFADEPEMYACFGYDVALRFGNDGDANSSDGESHGYLDFRVCTQEALGEDGCNMKNAGPCGEYGYPVVGSPSRACGTDVDTSTAYADCYDMPIGEGETKSWSEAVTTYLEQEDFDELAEEYLELEGCSVSTEAGPISCGPLGCFTKTALACDAATLLE